MIHFVIPANEDLIGEYVGHWGRGIADRVRIHRYEELPTRSRFERGTYVFTALDRLGPGMERLVVELASRLASADGVRILNHPAAALRRFELLEELARRNLNEFRAARAGADWSALRYPVFLRAERSHDGAFSPLLFSARQVETWIGRALLKGHALSDLLVVEFCDTVDEKGFYRRYAAFVVGTRVIPRGLEYGRKWMLKRAGTEFSREMVLEERDYVLGNPHRVELAEIFALARIEYGRIDYAIKGGRIQTWEINLYPTIGRGLRPKGTRIPEELEPIRLESKQGFYDGFREALEEVEVEVDLPAADPPSVEIALEPATIRGVEPAAPRDRRRRRDLVWKALRPVKPLLEPLATPFFPLLARLARGKR